MTYPHIITCKDCDSRWLPFLLDEYPIEMLKFAEEIHKQKCRCKSINLVMD